MCRVYTTPSHSRLLLLAECETQIQQLVQEKEKKTAVRLTVDGDNVGLVVMSRLAPVSWMLMRLL